MTAYNQVFFHHSPHTEKNTFSNQDMIINYQWYIQNSIPVTIFLHSCSCNRNLRVWLRVINWEKFPTEIICVLCIWIRAWNMKNVFNNTEERYPHSVRLHCWYYVLLKMEELCPSFSTDALITSCPEVCGRGEGWVGWVGEVGQSW